VTRDGSEALKVACRLGVLELPRHICYNAAEGGHIIPGNAVLPAHQGMVITRNLQEIACLLALDVPFETAQRLLVWETREAEMICTTEIRRLVRTHGEIIRAAEAAEVQELLARDDLSTLHAQLVEAPAPRRVAGRNTSCRGKGFGRRAAPGARGGAGQRLGTGVDRAP
jgi:hypothetical protein